MKKVKLILLFGLLLIFSNQGISQKKYKVMMNDNSYNFYEVCKEAEGYFEKNGKGKGSGWKGYQRWKHENESKFSPSGTRDNVDPYLAEKSYTRILNSSNLSRGLHSGKWKELGPFNLDSITGHYSAGLGRIVASYVHKSNPQIIYIGSRSGGFWKSINGGVTWTGRSTDTLVASGVGTISASPTNADSILIGVQNGGNGYSHGIYRSTDGGISWKQTNFNPTSLGKGGLGSSFKINKIAYHPRVPNLIFVAASDGLYRSTNNLSSWTKVTNGSISEIEFHPTNNNIVYIYDYYYWGSNKNYVLRSTDQGITFSNSATITGNNNSAGHISVSNDCSNCVYFASTNGVWKSTDNGMNFTFLSNPSQSCLGFAVNDMDTSKMVYGYVDVEVTNDGGKTFTKSTWWSLGSGSHGAGSYDYRLHNGGHYIHADLHPAVSVNGVYYVGTDGLFAKSTDNGTTWIVLSDGLAIRENYSLGASQSNHYRSISGSQDNGTSIKLKDTWLEFYGADGMEGIIHPLNSDWMIGSVQYGTRRRTKDAGQTQGGAAPSGQTGSGNGYWEAPLAYNPNDQMQLYNFAKDLYVSNDFGSNWQYLSTPFSSTITQAAIAENNSKIIVVSSGNSIKKSTDGGLSFTDIKNNLPSYTITDIAFDPKDDNTIIVTYNRYQDDGKKIFITKNGGATWINITYNLNDMPIREVVIDHTDESNIYLGAEIGVFTMPINGTNWTPYNIGLPNVTVKELEVVRGSNTLKAATWGRGLWEVSLKGRETFPAILTTEINDMPTDDLPKEGISQFVTSVVSYDNSISKVFVKWSKDSAVFNNQISMSNTVDSTYKSDYAIPRFSLGTKIFFKVFAIGNSMDTSETYKFQYTVRFNPSADVKINEKDKLSVKIFPNPTDGEVKLKFDKNIVKGEVFLYDELGKIIFTKNISSTKSVNMNISKYESGVYYILVNADGKKSVEKLIKK